LERADSLYTDILSKTGCSRIIALREDSSNETPAGLQEFSDSRGVSVSTTTIERLDLSNFSGDEDPGTLWSEHIATIVSNAGFRHDDSENDFLIGPGSGWNTSLLAAIHAVIGGRVWASVLTKDGIAEATEVGHELPDTMKALSTFAAAGQLSLEWGEGPFESVQLQGLVDGVPATEGIENTFRKHEGTLVNKRTTENDQVRFELTAEGRFRSILALAEKWEPTRIKGGPKGMILAARDAQDAQETIEVVEYLKEHNPALDFDAYLVVVNKHGSNESELAESSTAINDALSDYIGEDRIVTMPGSFVDADKELVLSHFDLLSLIHRARAEHHGIDWSVEVSRFLSPLRPATLLYAYRSGIDAFCLAKNPVKSEGGVFAAGLSGLKHRLALPTREKLDRIGEILRTDSIHKHLFTAAMAKDDTENPGTNLSSKLNHELRMYEWNRKKLPEGHSMRWPDMSEANHKQEMSKKRKTGIEKGAFEDNPDTFVLTPEGFVAATLLHCRQGEFQPQDLMGSVSHALGVR
jgi:hypothetical protein